MKWQYSTTNLEIRKYIIMIGRKCLIIVDLAMFKILFQARIEIAGCSAVSQHDCWKCEQMFELRNPFSFIDFLSKLARRISIARQNIFDKQENTRVLRVANECNCMQPLCPNAMMEKLSQWQCFSCIFFKHTFDPSLLIAMGCLLAQRHENRQISSKGTELY